MVVGDDVVDLAEPHIAGSHLRPRFVHRVLTEAERARLAAAFEPRRLLWALFAAKEAAYKAVSQLGPPPGFAFQRFEVAPDLGSVRFDGRVLGCRIRVSDERVHAIAWATKPPDLAAVVPLEGTDPSRGARRALCLAVAGRLGCSVDELAVIRDRRPGSWDGFGPPRLERRGSPLPGSVSLSHDGRFTSYAVTLQTPAWSRRS